VEDGSRLLEEVSSSFLNDPRIRFIALEKNRGPSYARNLGATAGRGAFVSFLDSDDLWEPEKLARQIEFLSENPSIQWVHTNERWVKDGKEIKQRKEHRKQGGLFIERLFERCLISPSSVLLRRDFWEAGGGYLNSFRVAEDYELWLRLNLFHPIGFIEDKLTIKRAGNWPQLSATLEIDRNRVLALHRFFRLFKNTSQFIHVKAKWLSEILRKIEILKIGAVKYDRLSRAKQYQSWESFFKTLRT